jgi:UDP-N-acetylglucosamine/UDP-N-acetylgalactosamine 4-epimerase
MKTAYSEVRRQLKEHPRTWLVTGAAGFIGSHLVETLLGLDQRVVGFDNLSTGFRLNIDEVKGAVSPEQWTRLKFIEGDISDLSACQRACQSVDHVLHQAALGSVPRSIEDPIGCNTANVNGFVNVCWASKQANVQSVVYASSSAVYGDHPALPKQEHQIGSALSPYGASKLIDEVYAGVFSRCYEMRLTGLRYFNVFGPRQNPEGAYAAVIPKWIAAMIQGKPFQIHGDGETSRDFCYIANIVQANILAAVQNSTPPSHQVFNVALNQCTTLNALVGLLKERLIPRYPHVKSCQPLYSAFRAGDVRHSQADIQRITSALGYLPTHDIAAGLDEALAWYVRNTAL